MDDGTVAGPGLPGTLRFRLTAVAALVVAVVLTASCVALVRLQRQVLIDNLDGSLEQRAASIAASFSDAATGEHSPELLADTEEEDRAVQVVGARGEVLASTANLLGADEVVPAGAAPAPEGFRTVSGLALPGGGDYRVLTREVSTPDGDVSIHLAQSMEDTEDAIASLVGALAVAVPAVIVALSLLMWWLTGRALGPVEQIRAEVDAIAGDQTPNRVRVPPRDDEIGRLAATMNRMLDRLDHASQRQARFVADAAHELRTPLSRIRAEMEVDLAHPERADAATTNRRVLRDTEDLQRLVDDLLFLARSDAQQATSRRVAIDLDDLVLAEVADQRLVTPGVEIDARGVSAAHLVADGDQLARVVRNLLSNAVRHAESVVQVSLAETDDRVRLVVDDDGDGIAAEDAERVFERFARLDEARSRSGGGTGVGLSIVREIVEGHGGTVVCDPSRAVGARFVVELPVEPPMASI